jgi:hypothetical protein
VLHKACGGANAKRQCVYKTDFPGGPNCFNTTDNSSDIHVMFMQKLAKQAAAMDIEVMAAFGVGVGWPEHPRNGGVGPFEYGKRIALALPTVSHWQVSEEWAVPHCMLPRVDYKHHWGEDKADYNATCMTAWLTTVSAVIRGLKAGNPDAVAMPISMGWTRLGIWQWIHDEAVPLDAIGLDWYSDGGPINCTCTEYLPDKCGQPGHKPCINFLDKLDAMFPGKPVWITEMNRKLASCNGTASVQPPGVVCGECSRHDACAGGLEGQAEYVATALQVRGSIGKFQ